MNEIDRLNQTLTRHNKRNKRLSVGIIIASMITIVASVIEIIRNVSN